MTKHAGRVESVYLDYAGTQVSESSFDTTYDFEADVEDWDGAAAMLTRSSSWVESGSHSLLIKADGTGATQWYAFSPLSACTPGATMHVTGWIHAYGTALGATHLNIDWFDGTGSYLSTTSSGNTAMSANTSRQVVEDVTAPVSAEQFRVSVVDSEAVAAGVTMGADLIVVQFATTTMTVIPVDFPIDFDEDGGQLTHQPQDEGSTDSTVYTYVSVDMDAETITLASPIPAGTFAPGDMLYLEPPAADARALVRLSDSEDEEAVDCRIDHALRPFLADGSRDPGTGESVLVDTSGDEAVVTDVVGAPSVLSGDLLVGGAIMSLDPTQPAASATAESWHPMTLKNGWANRGTPWAACQYKLNALNRVEIVINASGGSTGGVVLATLPAEYWPQSQQQLEVVCKGGTGNPAGAMPSIMVDTSGNLNLQDLLTGTVSIGCSASYSLDA